MPLLAESQARAAGLKAVPGDPGPPIVHQNLALLRGTAFFGSCTASSMAFRSTAGC